MAHSESPSQPPAVVILPAPEAVPTGLGIVRALGRASVPVVAVSAESRPLSGASRYVSHMWACPDPERDEPGFIRELVDRAQGCASKPVLFACTDPHVKIIQEHQTDLAPRYRHPFVSAEALVYCADKHLMCQAAEAAGLRVPHSHVVAGAEDVEAIARAADLPCFVRPSRQGQRASDKRSSRAWFEREFGAKAIRITARQELMAVLRRAAAAHIQVQVQDDIAGPPEDLYSCCLYASEHSEVLGAFVARKLRQFPYDGGTGTLVETVEQPAIQEMSIRLVKHIGYHGLAEIEFKRDSRDGQFKFIEMNARPWTWNSLGEACGVNLILVAYHDLIGEAPKAAPGPPRHVLWVDLYQDTVQFLEQRRLLGPGARTTLLGHLRALRGRRCHAYLAADDLGPTLRYARLVRGYISRRLARRVPRFLRGGRRAVDAS